MPDVRVGAFLVRLREGLSVRGVGRDLFLPKLKKQAISIETRRFDFFHLTIANQASGFASCENPAASSRSAS